MKSIYFILGTAAFWNAAAHAIERPTRELSGRALYSFSDSYYLIEVNDSIYRFRAEELSEEERKSFEINGASVSVRIPDDAIDLNWERDPHEPAPTP